MSDLDALYRAVLDRPDDDTPRLVYADALDDLGEPDRAAFVRAQVEAARADPWAPAAVRVRCFRGSAPPGNWLAELPDLPAGLSWAVPPFRRGFPALVQARDGAAFVAAADGLFDLAPVESLELAATRAADLRALRACPGLGRLRRLVIREGAGHGTAQALLNSPHLGALEELVIGAGLTSARTAAAVVAARGFRALRAFSYRDEQPGGAMVAALAGLADPPGLHTLDLQGNLLAAEGLGRLAAAPVAAGVACLDVSDNTRLGPDGFEALAAGVLPALRALAAMRTFPGPAGVRALGGAAFAPQLAAINLGGNNLGPDAAPALAALARPGLRVLDLRDNRLGDAGAADLLRAGGLGGLLHLDLSENGIGARGAEAVAATAGGLDGLIALDLGGNPIPEPARRQLRERFGDRLLI